MAENTNKVKWTNSDGVDMESTVPEFALDSTARQMEKYLKTISDKLGAQGKVLTDNAKAVAKSNEKSEETDEKSLEAIKSFKDVYAADFEKFGAGVGKFIETSFGVLGSGISSVVQITKFLSNSLMGFGDELNSLTAVGAGFTENGTSALQAMSALSFRGVDAAKILLQFSNVVQSVGKNAFTGLTNAFLDATNSGVDLGMSLDASVERMGEELQKRQLMGALDGVDRAKLTQQVSTSIKQQQKYASVLGVSTETLVKFTESLLNDTPVLSAAMLRLGPELRSNVLSGIEDFGTAMRAMGGEEGGKIAMAFTEAAASGALGFSDAMVGYVTAMPSLNGPMNEYINAIQSGTLSQEQGDKMAQELTARLGNVSQAEKGRIFALARAGDQHAMSLSKAIMQYDMSAKKLKDLGKGFTMSGIQTGSNKLQAILKELFGVLDTVKYSFLEGIGSTQSLTKSFEKAKETIFNAIKEVAKTFGFADGIFNKLTGTAENLGKTFAEALPKIIEGAARLVASFIEYIPTLIEFGKTLGNAIIGIGAFVAGIVAVATPLVKGFVALSSHIGNLGTAIVALVAYITAKAGVKAAGGAIGAALRGRSKDIGSKVDDVVGNSKSVGGGAGSGLKGLASGLMAFKLVPYGSIVKLGLILGVVTTAIYGLAHALKVAGPALEPFGKMVKSALEGVGNVVMSIGKGIASIIGGIADGIATITKAIMGDQEAMMKLQTEQIKVVNAGILALAAIPSDNLFKTALGIDAIANAMKSFADTVVGREGGLFDSIGNIFSGDKVDKTDKFIASMTKFASIDGEKIAFNAAAIINANRAQSGMTTTVDPTARARPRQAAMQEITSPVKNNALSMPSAKSASQAQAQATEKDTLSEILEQAKQTNVLLRKGNKGVNNLADSL